MFLTAEELQQLTGRRRRDAHVRMLRSMGIEHRVRADGTVAVLKAHVDEVFRPRHKHTRKAQNLEPDWS